MHNIINSLARLAAGAVLPVIILLALPSPANAIERYPFSMEVLVDGRPLHEYAARGTSYIEAIEGREYSIRLRNRTGRRVAIALSVDGLNSIDAKTTSMRDASKWVLAPYQTITIDGWQTDRSTARRFFFTTEERSYGAWLGKTSNLGVITAAVFREKQHRPKPLTSDQRRRSSYGEGLPSREMKAEAECDKAVPQSVSDEMAATGIGREVDNSVRRVRLNLEKTPAAVMEIRYEYHDALVSLGVLPCCDDPITRRERARGFEDMEFAPDPFRK